MSSTFKPSDWFQHLFGFKETAADVYKNFEVKEHPDHVEIVSKANGKSFNAGLFSVRNTSSFIDLKEVGGGSLNIIRGVGRNSPINNPLEAQSLPGMNGATFLAASNFNCLELPSGGDTPKSGVTGYIFDRTQGPYCALASGPATVYRNYFVKHESGKVGQLEEEIHLLKDTPLDVYTTHGYPAINEKAVAELKESGFAWDDLSKYSVGVHQNCQVTTTVNPQDGAFMDVEGRIIHQVYAGALNFAGCVSEDKFMIEIAKNVLKAEYQAAVLSAWENSQKFPELEGSKKLILPLLGGGVLANPTGIVCEAIRSAEELIVKSGLQVCVVCNDDLYYQVYPNLRSAMRRTGGQVIEMKSDL